MHPHVRYYFGAGPSALPRSVLEEIQAELMSWGSTGLSPLELGHRTEAFAHFFAELETLFRELVSIPPNYHVLWVGGSTRQHFGLIPMQFLGKGEKAGYVITGFWSQLAFEEAQRLNAQVEKLSPSDPSTQQWKDDFSYLYLTPNETIQGVRFLPPVEWTSASLVADMTSCLMTEPIDVSHYDFIFAGAQKNLANAGLTVLICSPQRLERACLDGIPTALSYPILAQHHSLLVTPPTFNCFVMLKMLQWVKQQGGIPALFQRNQQKARLLYEYIDQSNWYVNRVSPMMRSLVNVPFHLPTDSLISTFLQEAQSYGLCGLEGHRVVGGLRASLYNAMSLEGVEALIQFMQIFKERYA